MSFHKSLTASLLLTTATLFGCANLTENATEEESAISTRSVAECAGDSNAAKGKHAFHRGCEHYRHKVHHKGARIGHAQMTTRAMMDAAEMTAIEATTGTFDDGQVPPGRFEQVKLRLANVDRKHFSERVFGKTDTGYFATSMAGLTHGRAITITGTIKGIDPGADLVSVDDEVKYRPDLTVAHIDAPATASVGLPTTIGATVREVMGDLGANADCVLSVDGMVADKVTGMWVDGGSAVSCHFAYTFMNAGSHTLRVEAANVHPGDYDPTNNSASMQVAVADAFTFSGATHDTTYVTGYQEQVLDASSNVVYQQSSVVTGNLQFIEGTGLWKQAVAFPLASVSVTATSAGSTWSLINLTGVGGDSNVDGVSCSSRSDTNGYDWVTVCLNSAAGASTQITVTEFSGDVTYHSDLACRQTSAFYDCAGGYSINFDGANQQGERHPLAGSLALQFSLTDAAGQTLQSAPVIPLQPYSVDMSQPLACVTSDLDLSRDCSAQPYLESGVTGSLDQ